FRCHPACSIGYCSRHGLGYPSYPQTTRRYQPICNRKPLTVPLQCNTGYSPVSWSRQLSHLVAVVHPIMPRKLRHYPIISPIQSPSIRLPPKSIPLNFGRHYSWKTTPLLPRDGKLRPTLSIICSCLPAVMIRC